MQKTVEINSPKGRSLFKTFAQFFDAVKAGSFAGGKAKVDPRLLMGQAVSTEGAGEDGGYAVPPDYRTEIWRRASEDSLLGKTDQYTTMSNSVYLPTDPTTPWDSSGIQVSWGTEAEQLDQSKLKLGCNKVTLNKLKALVPVSEELAEDAGVMEAYLTGRIAEKFQFQLNLKMVRGSGAGEPLGILNSPSLITVSPEGEQAAKTILGQNILKMWARLYEPCQPNAVWLIKGEIVPQFYGMAILVRDPSGNTYVPATPLFQPASRLPGSFPTLMGRPIIPTQACSALGTKGDIILADLKQYATVVKTGGVKTDVSMHVWFDYDVMAFRFVLRIAGLPWWASDVLPRTGSDTLSWAVTLDDRT